MSLAGLRVLVTRPEQQGSSLVARISKAGGVALHYPVLAIVPLSLEDTEQRQQLKQRILDLDLYHHVIFISTNAVKYGIDWIEDYWPQIPIGIQWYAIGSATAQALIDKGFEASAPTVAMNSEALLAMMPLSQVAQQKVLIIRGVGGRDHLAQQLSAQGAQVDYAECYRRAIPDSTQAPLAELLATQQINVVCVNSGESLENFCQMLADNPVASYHLIVPSHRIASLAQKRGFRQVEVAINASDDAVLLALEKIAAQQPAA